MSGSEVHDRPTSNRFLSAAELLHVLEALEAASGSTGIGSQIPRNENASVWSSSLFVNGIKRKKPYVIPNETPSVSSPSTSSCLTDKPDDENSSRPVKPAKSPARISSFPGIGFWGEDYEARELKMRNYLIQLAEQECRMIGHPEPQCTPFKDDVDLGDLKPICFRNRLVGESLYPHDFTASIILEKHIELWDQRDDCIFVLRSEVYLSCKESDMMEGSPNVCYLAMECRTIHPSRPSRPAALAYSVNCTSHKFRPLGAIEERGIRVQPLWMPRYPKIDSSECGWYFTFWTPIPLSLFLSADTRTFQFSIQLGFGSRASEGSLSAQKLLSISHLRKDRDMVSTSNRHGCSP